MAHSSRMAAIDLGSNSFHLLLAQPNRSGGTQVLSRQRQKVRLADGLNRDNQLSDEAINRGLACLASFAELLRGIPEARVRCVATATLRIATNRADVIKTFEQVLGFPVEIISGEDEAALIYQGATLSLASAARRMLVLDIGGASTEIIVGTGTRPSHLRSLDMGCVVWHNRFFSDKTITASACDDAIQAASELLQPHVSDFLQHPWQLACGASGTFRALYDILQRENKTAIGDDWLEDVLQRSIRLGKISRLGQLGVRRERQPMFIGGLTILVALVRVLGIEEIIRAQGALREGLLHNLVTSASAPATSDS
ncbi:Ppx/GppA family phosphatase [Pseudidiomarina sp.]|uniref:Ppx/GppA phosphatase family protein n=1 Tax=Pseudidiomarina sp. TaxID=2081707 RepID=UPI00299F39DC|nr:Ppx/GppA family phosphatase [Pseudidiomarina sp.]MDX1705394.1 Ppx/GppA family phosphatase [Pseudidiomarina sp.]